MKRNEILEQIRAISKEDTSWKLAAEKRMRQRWWKKYWNRIFLKWLRLKRKLKAN